MSKATTRIPKELRERNPLMTSRAAATLRRMKEHPDAPKWNYACGDRIGKEDLPWIERFRESLEFRRVARKPGPPVGEILAAVAGAIPEVALWRHNIPRGIDLVRDWAGVPTTSREDLAMMPGACMPDGVDMARMIVHNTSGTTGHSILIPQHPIAGALYGPMMDVAMAAHGVRPAFSEDSVGAILVGAQSRCVTYATVHSTWNNSGFAKINLNPADWPAAGSAVRWITDMAALLYTGSPNAFAEMLKLELPVRPAAMISTATTLVPGLVSRLEKAFGCPVIDWYSLNETGPIAYRCPRSEFHVLPPDLHVEVVGADGTPLAPGTRGEICVTGGRNPFLPLLRYRTGDRAVLSFDACPCGDPTPRLLDFEGRESVTFRADDGAPVIPVDVSRVIRQLEVIQHRFVQRADRSCDLTVRPFEGSRLEAADVERAMRPLFGARTTFRITLDPQLGVAEGGKIVAYISELP